MHKQNFNPPIYIQIKDLIIEKIKRGEYSNGSKLPSERELSRQYGVSRMTARNALNEIVREGWAFRDNVKGTFVKSPKINRDLTRLTGFSQMLKERGIKPSNKLIKKKIIEADKQIAQSLNLLIGENVYFIERLRCGNDFPIALEYSFIPCKLFDNLLKYDFEIESLYDILEKNYNCNLIYAKQTLSLSYVDRYEAKMLRLEENAAILLFEGITYDEEKIPIEYTKSLQRGDSCIFYNELWKLDKSNNEKTNNF